MDPLPDSPMLEAGSGRPPRARWRRRGMRLWPWPVTAILTLLMALAIFEIHHRKDREAAFYDAACATVLDKMLLTLQEWDQAGQTTRGLSGFANREDFVRQAGALAELADQRGFLGDRTRLRLVVLHAHLELRREAEVWLRTLSDETALEWGRAALNTQSKADFAVYFYAMMHGEEERMSDSAVKWRAAFLYSKCWITTLLDYFLMVCAVIMLWPVCKRLRGRPVSRHRLMTHWRPCRLWQVAVLAELLGFGIMWGLTGLVFLFEGMSRSAVVEWSTLGQMGSKVLASLENPFVRLVVVTMVSLVPPWVMMRYLTPGWAATRRIFGMNPRPLSGGAFWMAALFGLAVVRLWYWGMSSLSNWLGIVDLRDSLANMENSLFLELVLGCVLAPVVEELVFRGFIFSALKAHWGTGAAAVVSSACFSAVHGYSLAGSVLIAGVGMILCFLFHRTGCLTLTMVIHALMNLILIF